MQIFDKDYELAYTVRAQADLAEHFGGFEESMKALDIKAVGDYPKLMFNVAYTAAALMRGWAQRERVRCKMMGETADIPDTPGVDDLLAIWHPNDVPTILPQIFAAISEGNRQTVKAKAPDEKNVKTTQ